MNTEKFLAVFAIVVLLASCAQLNPHPMDMTSAIRRAQTEADHNALARHYEAAAEDMRLRVQEHKKELEEYETRPYYYGKRAQDLKAHCQKLISSYEQAAEANLDMAKDHRKMAEGGCETKTITAAGGTKVHENRLNDKSWPNMN